MLDALITVCDKTQIKIFFKHNVCVNAECVYILLVNSLNLFVNPYLATLNRGLMYF